MTTSTSSTSFDKAQDRPLTTNKLSASQKGFSLLIIILGIILVIGIAGGSYYFGKTQNSKPQPQNLVVVSQTPQTTTTPSPSPAPSGEGETANWKTYTNNKYGIQFSYPSNLKPGKYTSDNGTSLVADFSDDQNNDLQVWVALSGGVGHGGDFSMKQLSNDTKVKVASYGATLIISETDLSSSLYSTGDPILRRYSVVLDNKPVIIELTGKKANTSIDQLNQILSSFKFTQ